RPLSPLPALPTAGGARRCARFKVVLLAHLAFNMSIPFAMEAVMKNRFEKFCIVVFSAFIALAAGYSVAAEPSASKIASDGKAALNQLYAKVPAAKALGGKSTAILVFPSITKAGLGI